MKFSAHHAQNSPPKLQNICEKRAYLYRLTPKNEKKTSKTRVEGAFYCILKRTKTSKYYILFNIRLSRPLQLFIKYGYISFCLERLQYMNRKKEREKEMVFQGIMSRNWLSELRKCAPDGTFHPCRRVKREGEKAG